MQYSTLFGQTKTVLVAELKIITHFLNYDICSMIRYMSTRVLKKAKIKNNVTKVQECIF